MVEPEEQFAQEEPEHSRAVSGGFSFPAGLILGVLTLFLGTATLRLTCATILRGDYVRDEFEFEYYTDESTGGYVVSTGEHFALSNPLLPLEEIRDLSEQGTLNGRRTPIWYLPKRSGWGRIGTLFASRVMSPSEFELSSKFRTRALIINLVMAWGSFMLIRRGLRSFRKAEALARELENKAADGGSAA